MYLYLQEEEGSAVVGVPCDLASMLVAQVLLLLLLFLLLGDHLLLLLSQVDAAGGPMSCLVVGLLVETERRLQLDSYSCLLQVLLYFVLFNSCFPQVKRTEVVPSSVPPYTISCLPGDLVILGAPADL